MKQQGKLAGSRKDGRDCSGRVDSYELKHETFIWNPNLPIPINQHVLKCKKAFLVRKEDEHIDDEYGIYPYIAEEMYEELYPKKREEEAKAEQAIQSQIDRSYSIIESDIPLEEALRQIQTEYSSVTNYYYTVISNSGIRQTKQLLKFLDSIQ